MIGRIYLWLAAGERKGFGRDWERLGLLMNELRVGDSLRVGGLRDEEGNSSMELFMRMKRERRSRWFGAPREWRPRVVGDVRLGCTNQR
ncbi:hypothetical protein MA16_Dca015728 [Dendrobium catenatum]|uniref:Uncharacterized protein n=1 Tax=Dendrobium catenatum TaxID=906689 RepID=A0A2I0WHS0_9ASPA|nr:hypothetical protein MA16_Dca015728 [Dendrobium catenatum]